MQSAVSHQSVEKRTLQSRATQLALALQMSVWHHSVDKTDLAIASHSIANVSFTRALTKNVLQPCIIRKRRPDYFIMLHNGVVVVIVSPSWFFGFAAELQSKILLVARGSSPKLEQTFFTGMGKIDCHAGGNTFFVHFLSRRSSTCNLESIPAWINRSEF